LSGIPTQFGKCHCQISESILPRPRRHVPFLVQMFWGKYVWHEIPPCGPSMLYIHLIIDATRTIPGPSRRALLCVPAPNCEHIYAPGPDPLGFLGSLCSFHNGTRSYNKVAITTSRNTWKYRTKALGRTF